MREEVRDVYAEGMCVLLKKIVNNSTSAYKLAEHISNQGNYNCVARLTTTTVAFIFALYSGSWYCNYL